MASLTRKENHAEGTGRRQTGSVLEGFGGRPGCSSREVELEFRLEESEFIVARLGKELDEALRAQRSSEDHVEVLEAELKSKNELLIGLREQKVKRPSINQESNEKDQCEALKKLEEDLEKTKRKLKTEIEGKVVLESRLLGEQGKCRTIEGELLAREAELEKERKERGEFAEQLEETKLEVELLRETRTERRVISTDESPNVSIIAHNDSQNDKVMSMVHDLSLDDGLVESGKFLVQSSVSSLSLVEELVEVTGEEERLTCSKCDEKFVHVPEEAKQRLIRALHQVVPEERSEEVNSAVSTFLEEVEGRFFEEAGEEQRVECSADWSGRNWLWACLLIFFGLASFTFCGLKLNHTEYYPATWHGLRCVCNVILIFDYKISFS